jgi:uncharacterized delta-60 repeat protein
VFANADTRVPTVVQADGRMIVGGSRGGAMTLVRYNTNGSIDTSFGVGGFASGSFGGTPSQTSGNSGATAMAIDPANNTIIAAGFGGSQSMVAARFSATGTLINYTVCYAPHLIDYTARGVAVRPNGQVVLVGYARDRHPAFAVPVGPNVMYGQRAAVTVPNTVGAHGNCGAYADNNGQSLGSAGVTIDGLDHYGVVQDATLGGRWYEGVATNSNTTYTVATTVGPDGASWVERYLGNALDASFNVTGRLGISAVNLHAIKLGADGSAFVAGEAVAAAATDRTMVVAHVSAAGALTPGYGAGGSGIARIRVAGGNNSGQALVLQGNNVIVGGSANLAGRAAFGIARLTATGVADPTFGPLGAGGQVASAIGVPAVNAFITGLAINGNYVYASGRASDPNGLAAVAARYFHTGTAAPPPAPVAATNAIDQITTTSARVNGALNANGYASNWWIEYGTTAAYGAQTPAQSIAGTIDDVEVSATLTGLLAGTTYHARLVVTSAAGTDPGDDIAFTTLGVAVPVAGTTAPVATTPVTPTGGTKPATTTVKKIAKKKLSCIVPKVTGKKLNAARRTVLAKGCKVTLKYVASKKAKNTVLAQSRKAGKKLGYRAVVKLTVADKASAIKKS